MNILENQDLSQYSSIKIGGIARYFAEIESEDDIRELVSFAHKQKMPLIVIGSGTNTFFGDGIIKKVFGLIKIKGRFKTYENSDFINVKIGAGENWDELVDWTIKQKLNGLEALSLIPGTVGAAPVQNIGAYGQEIKNIITNVRAYDTDNDVFMEIPNDQCQFDYRDSIFKKNPGKFIISHIAMQLKKNKEDIPIPQYKDLQLYFLEKGKKKASPKEIREAVIKIRKEKLPDYNTIPNCGSFFKNPVISKEFTDKLLAEFPQMPHFVISEDRIKIFSGWLIDYAGLKGFEYKNLSISQNNSLVITNKINGNENTKASHLLELEKIIKDKIYSIFEITLEREPNYIN